MGRHGAGASMAIEHRRLLSSKIFRSTQLHQVAMITVYISNVCPSTTLFWRVSNDKKTAENSSKVALQRASTLQKKLFVALTSSGSAKLLYLQFGVPIVCQGFARKPAHSTLQHTEAYGNTLHLSAPHFTTLHHTAQV